MVTTLMYPPPLSDPIISPSSIKPPNAFSKSAIKRMYANRPLSLIQLTPPEVDLFASIFSHPEHNPVSNQTADSDCDPWSLPSLLQTLPPRLTNPTPGAFPQKSLCKMLNDAGADLPLPAPLCKTHSTLNAQLVQDAFDMVVGEIEDHLPTTLNRIAASTSCFSHKRSRFAPSPIPEYIRHRIIAEAEAFLACYLDADEYIHWYGRAPPQMWAQHRHLPPCCILTLVGSSPQLLCALRALLIARIPHEFVDGKKVSARMLLFEAWVQGLESEGLAVDVLQRSSKAGAELRALRMRREGATPPVPERNPSRRVVQPQKPVSRDSSRGSGRSHVPPPLPLPKQGDFSMLAPYRFTDLYGNAGFLKEEMQASSGSSYPESLKAGLMPIPELKFRRKPNIAASDSTTDSAGSSGIPMGYVTTFTPPKAYGPPPTTPPKTPLPKRPRPVSRLSKRFSRFRRKEEQASAGSSERVVRGQGH